MTADLLTGDDLLSEDDWEDLLFAIHAQQVIPLIGPELVTVPAPEPVLLRPLYQALAPSLAEKLDLPNPERYTSCDEAARDFMFNGGKRQRIYVRLARLLDGLDVEAPQALRALARIDDFKLYLCSTPDPLMTQALMHERPGFDKDSSVLRFHPSDARDLPSTEQAVTLFHILGDYLTQPDFVVWEEDYIEFICGLLERAPGMPELFGQLQRKHLLLLGAPSSDWIVRFLLRVARRQRLSDKRDEGIYLADRRVDMGEPMVFFFEGALKVTKIVNGSPRDFVLALERRWQRTFGRARGESRFLESLPERFVRGSVFLSYSRDDIDQVLPLAQDLQDAGVPVWLDKSRLRSGQNFERELERAIKSDCSFFIALISKATESSAERYVHQERRWAAERHVDGYVFYIPLILDLPVDQNPKLEPERVAHVHRENLQSTDRSELIRRIKRWMDDYRGAGEPPRN